MNPNYQVIGKQSTPPFFTIVTCLIHGGKFYLIDGCDECQGYSV